MDIPLQTYKISIEEFALATSLMGRPEIAKSLLYTALENMSGEEEKGRLFAAGHSLLAHGLLTVKDRKSHLDSGLRQALLIFLDNDFFVHLNSNVDGEGHSLTYFVREQNVVEQYIKERVIYHLTELPSMELIIERSLELLPVSDNNLDSFPMGEVETSVIEEARRRANTAPDTLEKFFLLSGLEEKLSHHLAEDFCHTVWQGSVVRMGGGNGQILSDQGFLLLQGQVRCWIFALATKGVTTVALILPGNKIAFSREMQRLLSAVSKRL